MTMLKTNDGASHSLLGVEPQAIAATSVGRVICDLHAPSPSFTVIHVRLSPKVDSPRPGTWLSVHVQSPDGVPYRLLGRVVNVWEHNPHEDAQGSLIDEVLPFNMHYAKEGDSTVIYRVAEVEPMEQAQLDIGETIASVGEVTYLPRAGAMVELAPDTLIMDALGLLASNDLGLEMGTLRGTATPAILKREVIQRHIFIGGGIGSGKSYTRGVLAEELHMQGVPQINVDVNGEMVEATKQLGGINLVPGKDGFTLPLSSLTAADVLDAIPGLERKSLYTALIEYAHEALLKERVLDQGKHFTVADLIDKISEVAPTLEAKAISIAPARQRAKALEHLTYIGEPFGWEKHLKPGAVINIDCRGLLVSDLRLIVASIARDLQRLARAENNLFVAFSIDEFHLVAPNDDKSVTTQVLREIARIGRHYKIGLILTTQSPQDVDKSILKRLLTRFLHAIEPDQLDALRGVFSDASDDLVRMLPKLPQGTCIVTGAIETVRHAAVVQIRKRHTEHGGGTPPIWDDFAKRGWTERCTINLADGTSDDVQGKSPEGATA